jgi:hypothetical protein
MNLTPQAHSLEERVQRIEDHLAIQNLIAAYGPAADSCNMEDMTRIWHEDCVYDIGGIGRYEGHERLKQAFQIDFHTANVKQGSGHASTYPHVVIEGDRATATHYGTLFARRGDQFVLLRLTASRWDLQKFPGEGWRVMKRTNRALDGNPEARQVLTETQQPPSQVSVGKR